MVCCIALILPVNMTIQGMSLIVGPIADILGVCSFLAVPVFFVMGLYYGISGIRQKPEKKAVGTKKDADAVHTEETT